MSARVSKSDRDEAIERLREWLKPGDTVYTILRHVSRSGMQREISLKALRPNGEAPYHLDGNVAEALGDRIGKHDGVVVGGCGMDMGFHIVYTLSSVLFREGWQCIGEKCHSSEHQGHPDHDGKVSKKTGRLPWVNGPARDGKMIHKGGGYALLQRWL